MFPVSFLRFKKRPPEKKPPPKNFFDLLWDYVNGRLVMQDDQGVETEIGGGVTSPSDDTPYVLLNGSTQTLGDALSIVIDEANVAASGIWTFSGVESTGGVVALQFAIKNSSFTGTFYTLGFTGNRLYEVQDRSGVIQMLPKIVNTIGPSSGFTLTVTDKADQTHYVEPAGTLATGTFELPSAANSRTGQIVRFHSYAEITSMTVTIDGSTGSISGDPVLTAATNTTYSWQCINAATSAWIRL